MTDLLLSSVRDWQRYALLSRIEGQEGRRRGAAARPDMRTAAADGRRIKQSLDYGAVAGAAC
jgi:hypothetical protein